MDEPATEQPDNDPLAGPKIREARERLGMSRRELAERIEPPASEKAIARWESGDFRPKSPRRESLASILGLDLTGSGSLPPRETLVRSLLAIRTMIDDLIAKT